MIIGDVGGRQEAVFQGLNQVIKYRYLWKVLDFFNVQQIKKMNIHIAYSQFNTR